MNVVPEVNDDALDSSEEKKDESTIVSPGERASDDRFNRVRPAPTMRHSAAY